MFYSRQQQKKLIISDKLEHATGMLLIPEIKSAVSKSSG